MEIKVTDNAGNVTTETVEVTKIDKTAATLAVSGNATSWTNGDVVLTAAATDAESGIASIQYCINGTCYDYTDSIVMSENGTVEIKVTDNAGNVTTETVEVTMIDKTVPGVIVNGNASDWTNGDVILTATATDAESGIASILYSTDGTNWNNYADRVTASENGTFYFKSVDVAGNESDINTVIVSKIDKVNPVVTGTADSDVWTNGDVTVIATATDAESGITAIEYSTNGVDWNACTGSISMSANGSLYFRSIDGAGNVSAINTVNVGNIDKEAPEVAVSGNVEGWTNSDVVLVITATDDASKVAGIRYCINGTCYDYTDSIVMSENGTVEVTVTDNAGNVTTEIVTVSGIDKVAPGLTVSGNAASWTDQDVILTATATDAESGIASIKYSFDGANWMDYSNGVVVSENGNVYFQSFDAAGNTSGIETVVVDKISKPEVSGEFENLAYVYVTGLESDAELARYNNAELNMASGDTVVYIGSEDGNPTYMTLGTVNKNFDGTNDFVLGSLSAVKVNGGIEDMGDVILGANSNLIIFDKLENSVLEGVESDQLFALDNGAAALVKGDMDLKGGVDSIKANTGTYFGVEGTLKGAEIVELGTGNGFTVENIEGMISFNTGSYSAVTVNTYTTVEDADVLYVGENSGFVAHSMNLLGGDDTVALGPQGYLQADTLDFGAGNDTLLLTEGATLYANNISGLETVYAQEGSTIWSQNEFDFEGVAGTWQDADLFQEMGGLTGGEISGSTYDNEWDLYKIGSTGTLTLGELAEGLDVQVLTDGVWNHLDSAATLAVNEGDLLKVSVADGDEEKDAYSFKATIA